MAKKSEDPDTTRERLVQAAGEVFAEHGFQDATVREICRRADANVAAVNYHFRDKQELYHEVFRRAQCAAVTQAADAHAVATDLKPRDRLHVFIHTMLQHMLGGGSPGWMGRLMAHEMVFPTTALDMMVRDSIRPTFDRLQVIVREVTGMEGEDEDVRYLASCVIGQIAFWKHSRPVIERLYPDMQYDQAQVDLVANYITDFSFAALKSFKVKRPAAVPA